MKKQHATVFAEMYYESWPKKGGRTEAIKLLITQINSKGAPYVSNRLQQFLDIIRNWKGDKQFIPNLKNFSRNYLTLSDGGWNEQIECWKKTYSNNRGSTSQTSGETNRPKDPTSATIRGTRKGTDSVF